MNLDNNLLLNTMAISTYMYMYVHILPNLHQLKWPILQSGGISAALSCLQNLYFCCKT